MPSKGTIRIIRAAFKLISTNVDVKVRYKTIRLVEWRRRQPDYTAGMLIVSGESYRQQQLISESANVGARITLDAVLVDEPTSRNSELRMHEEEERFRELLSSNLPLLDADDDATSVCDGAFDFNFVDVDYSVKSLRIPRFEAIYSEKIDPRTGDRVA